MVDILIKNMEMPKCCCGKEYCQFVAQDYTGKFHCTLAEFKSIEPKCLKSKRPNDCPLVEVKPHGRLIDADELVGNISDTYCEECPKTKPIMCKACEYEDIMDDIENAPTVLEASNGE